MSLSEPTNVTKQLPPKLRSESPSREAQCDTAPAIQFPVDGLNSISASLPVRAMKRAEPRWSLRLGRCALLSVLLTATASVPAQSLWKADSSRAIVSDKRARAVGDLLTILVQENNTATKDNSTKTGKSTSVDASIASFLYSPAASGFLTKNGQMPALKAAAKQDFDGGGKISNSEKITARISVRVLDVLPNGNLVIEGRRATTFSGETQDAVLRGVVRPEDIAANNTLYSYNIADATIKYVSSGTISDNQRKGWFTRIWEKVTPF
jgi:flagellar L-ring protein precursor FlgH